MTSVKLPETTALATTGSSVTLAGCNVTLPTVIMPTDNQERALARAELARKYLKEIARAPHGRKVQARAALIDRYNLGVYPTLYAILGAVSWQTVERWASVLRETGDALQLADRRGGTRAGFTSVTADQQRALLACWLDPNAPLYAEAIDLARARMDEAGIPHPQSDDTFYR